MEKSNRKDCQEELYISCFREQPPEQWMLEAGEYTMKRFAGLYGMEYGGMATNGDEASKLFKA